jgi:hypothetical protein
LNCGGCALTLILALTVAAILIAWDQQEGMPASAEILRCAPRRRSEAGDLSSIIDIQRILQVQRRAAGNEGVQVDGRSTVLPENRV